jgi:hypothetical protein
MASAICASPEAGPSAPPQTAPLRRGRWVGRVARAGSPPLSHAVTERALLFHGRDHLDLDHRLGLGEAADLDRRAGRTTHPEISHAHVRALRERLVVGDEGVGLDNIRPGSAGGFQAGVEVLESMFELRHWTRFRQAVPTCPLQSVDAAIILPPDVGRVLEHRAVQVNAGGAGKRPGTAAGLDEVGPVNWSAIFKPSGKMSSTY